MLDNRDDCRHCKELKGVTAEVAVGTRAIYARNGRYHADWRSTPYRMIAERQRQALTIPGMAHGVTCLGQAIWCYDARKEELQRRLDVAVTRAVTTRTAVAPVPTLEALARMFLEVVARDQARTTPRPERAVAVVQRTLERALGTKTLSAISYADQLTRPMFQEVLDELATIPKKSGALIGAGTLHRMGRVLVGWLTWCEDTGHLHHHPWRRHPAMKRLREQILEAQFRGTALTAAECGRLLDWLLATEPDRARTNPHLLPLVATLLYTGMRWSECAGLLVKDVDLRTMTIEVRPHSHRRLKNKPSRRTIPIQRALLPYLVPLLRGRKPDHLLFPAPPRFKGHDRKDKRKDPMPKTALGERMYRKIETGLRMTCCDSGIRQVRTHDLRHTYATIRASMVVEDALGQVVPVHPMKLARELGHKDLKMLSDVYYHDRRIYYGLKELDFEAARRIEHELEERQRARAMVWWDIPVLSEPPAVLDPPFKGRGLLRARLYQAYMAGVNARLEAAAATQRMKLDAGTETASDTRRSCDPDVMPPEAELPPLFFALVPPRLGARGVERARLFARLWAAWAVGRSGVPWLGIALGVKPAARASARSRRARRSSVASGVAPTSGPT